MSKKVKVPSNTPSPDITERKQVEEALQESEERYRALLELGGEVGEAVIMTHDTERGEGIPIFVNNAWPRITGYSERELLGMSFFDLVTPGHREASLERHYRKMRGEAIPGLFELSIVRKDGTEVPIELTSAYTIYKGEHAIVAYIRDITERKQVEHALNERVKELQCLYSIAYIVERPGITLDELCQEVANLLPAGWQYPEITCARVTLGEKEFMTDNFRTTEWKQSANINVKGQNEGSIEVYYLEERPELDEEPFLKEEKLLLDVVAERLGRITERGWMEEELNLKAQLVDAATDLIHVTDSNWNILYVNEASCLSLGYSRDELVGHNLREFMAPESAERLPVIDYEASGKARPPTEYVHIRKDKTVMPMEVHSRIISWSGKKVMLAVVCDITERKRVEDEMRSFNELAVDREFRMIELKKEINTILQKLGEEPRYKIIE